MYEVTWSLKSDGSGLCGSVETKRYQKPVGGWVCDAFIAWRSRPISLPLVILMRAARASATPDITPRAPARGAPHTRTYCHLVCS